MINPTKKYLCLALASIVLVTPIQTLATGAAPPATSNGSGSSNNILGDIQGQISGVIKGDSTGTYGNAAAPSPTEGMDSQAKEAAKAKAATPTPAPTRMSNGCSTAAPSSQPACSRSSTAITRC